METLVRNAPEAFDLAASRYDAEFDASPVVFHLRSMIWGRLMQHFPAGSHLLELNCGTGTDAIYLARHGVRVTATDASQEMIEVARQKVSRAGLSDAIVLKQVSFGEISRLAERNAVFSFDGVFSNFGGLNCENNLEDVLQKLAALLKPGAMFVACVMNKLAIGEIVSFVSRGNFRHASRRLQRKEVYAEMGASRVPVRYYTPRQFRRLASPWFEHAGTIGLSILSPYPHARTFMRRHPKLSSLLLDIDGRIASLPLFRNLGDHFVIELRKKHL